MVHPRMYEDDDPLLARLRVVCLDLPESIELEAWGRPTFRAGKKIFALFSDGEGSAGSVIFKPDVEERAALVEDARITVPPYWGPSGWLALTVDEQTDWGEVGELVEDSYRQVALKRMVAALDARR